MGGPEGTSDALEKLVFAADKTAALGPCANQVAVARNGELLAFRAAGSARFGGQEQAASERSLFALFSVTKAIVSSAVWILLQEGKISLSDRAVRFVPQFGTLGKDVVTVEQLLVHTAGFPSARMEPLEWLDPIERRARFAAWPLEWQPGSRFTYHGSATMLVLAEIITALTGLDYRDFIRTRIFEPLALADLFIGLPTSEHSRVADVVTLGDPLSDEERRTGPVDAPAIPDEELERVNGADFRRIGSPGGGAIGTAAALARFYQALLADLGGHGAGIWQASMLEDAFTPRHVELIDPMTKQPALRGLGVVVAGEGGRIWRGFANTCGPRSIGHMGAGGQIAWGDPASGISFAYCTNGSDRNPARQGANGMRLSSLAAAVG